MTKDLLGGVDGGRWLQAAKQLEAVARKLRPPPSGGNLRAKPPAFLPVRKSREFPHNDGAHSTVCS
jgi:hypothetical protein